jgi:hypothetical protein
MKANGKDNVCGKKCGPRGCRGGGAVEVVVAGVDIGERLCAQDGVY